MTASLSTSSMKTSALPGGASRVILQTLLGRTRIRLQIDVGFQDQIYPAPVIIKYPALLDFPPPVLRGDTLERVISEKFEAMVTLGTKNNGCGYQDLNLGPLHYQCSALTS